MAPKKSKPRKPVKGAEIPLKDLELHAEIELGRARMPLQDFLKLGPGAVVELDSKIEDPASLYVNGRLVAKGEIFVVDECFAFRVTAVIA